MRAVIDTNVLIDVFERREPFFAASAAVARVCNTQFTGHILANQVNDVCYLLRRILRDSEAVREVAKDLSDNFDVIDLTRDDIRGAAHSDMPDFEDAVIAYRAKRVNADFIITRNVKDFAKSPVKAVTPEDFLRLLED